MNKKLSIEEMHLLAESRGGKCLSEQYIKSSVHLKWECSQGHQWEATPNNVKRGTWCRVCAGLVKPTINEVREYAQQRGGACLSEEYTNAHVKLIWACDKKHTWEATLHDIKQGTWCPRCSAIKRGINHRGHTVYDENGVATKRAYSIHDVKVFAEKLEGECLSTEYTLANKKLKWKCKYGHKFEKTFTDVLANKWCPSCSRYYSESYCRLCFEMLFGVEFNKQKPKWLINSNGNTMELDGYNEGLKLAFEYHGEQHYRKVHFFHNNENDFKRRTDDDAYKELICNNYGVILIIVPFTVEYDDMLSFIINECEKRNISTPTKLDIKSLNTNILFINRQYEEVRAVIENRKGKLLSTVYTGSIGNLKVMCENGHIWSPRFSHIKDGVWCPVCAGNVRSTIDEMQLIAESRGGKCLTKEYKNAHTKLKWQCKEGHTWFAKAHDIKSANTWCPFCAGRGKTIEGLMEYAISKGGKCLSEKYEGVEKNLKWQCSKGHIWDATPRIADTGSWCRVCNRRRLTIEEMKLIAETRGGKCLSTEYIKGQVKLKWQCKEGHIWLATPMSIKHSQSWCPVCSKSSNLRQKIVQPEKWSPKVESKGVKPTFLTKLSKNGEKTEYPTRKFDPPKNRRVNFMPVE